MQWCLYELNMEGIVYSINFHCYHNLVCYLLCAKNERAFVSLDAKR